MREAFRTLFMTFTQEETFLINKSQTNSNISFNFNTMVNDPTLMLTRRDLGNSTYYSDQSRNEVKALTKYHT